MKILNVLRHAKSSWADSGQSDIDRVLNPRGEKDCITMAPAIEEAGCKFDYVVVSPASRAQQTISGINSVLQFGEWYTEAAMYTFDWRQLNDCVAALADGFDDALLVGHNPAITEFCNHLSDARIDNVPTCSFARIEFSVDSWRDIKDVEGKMTAFITPKSLV
ncbi:MAG: histidine phosphatase family protein [Pseudomonadales bacterium]